MTPEMVAARIQLQSKPEILIHVQCNQLESVLHKQHISDHQAVLLNRACGTTSKPCSSTPKMNPWVPGAPEPHHGHGAGKGRITAPQIALHMKFRFHTFQSIVHAAQCCLGSQAKAACHYEVPVFRRIPNRYLRLNPICIPGTHQGRIEGATIEREFQHIRGQKTCLHQNQISQPRNQKGPRKL